MATENVEVKVTTCDGCGKRQVRDLDDEELVLGFHGHVGWHRPSGGHGAYWYACRERCIRNAVMNTLEKAFDD